MNVLTLTGRLDADPIRRDTPKGVVCEFRLIVDSRPRLYLTVQVWGHLAGRCAKYLRASRRVAISSQLIHEQWVTRTGEPADRWYARAHDVTFLDAPPRDVDGDQDGES